MNDDNAQKNTSPPVFRGYVVTEADVRMRCYQALAAVACAVCGTKIPARHYFTAGDDLSPGTIAQIARCRACQPFRWGAVDVYDGQDGLLPEATAEDAPFAIRFAQALLPVLSEREHYIIVLRWGLLGSDAHTLTAIGEIVGVTRERIRQIEVKALRKLRLLASSNVLNKYPAVVALTEEMRAVVEPSASGTVERLVTFIQETMPQHDDIVFLFINLIYPQEQRESVRQWYRDAREQARLRLVQEARDARVQQRFERLFEGVVWPEQYISIDGVAQTDIRARRAISPDSSGISGSFRSEKLDRMVAYESQLELQTYLLLDASPSVAWFQEQPVEIAYRWEERDRRYFPDVLIALVDGRIIIGEVKLRNDMALAQNWAKWAALRVYCQDHGYGFLITDGRCTIQDVRGYERNIPFEQELLQLLEQTPLDWSAYLDIRTRHEAKWGSFVAAIM